MNKDEPRSAKRRAEARERLQRRSEARARDEADAEQAALERRGLGDEVRQRPWLGVLLMGAAAALPGPMSRVLDAFTDEPVSQRDIGLHDFVGRHPRLCGSIVLVVMLAGVATLVAFMANWI